MTLTLLFDLDDTLLGNNIDTFLPAYLKALGQHLFTYIEPGRMVRHLLAGTQVMIENDTPLLTLEKAFDRSFYPAIERTKEEMRPALEQFYGDVFPGLEPLTQQWSEAVEIVQWARKQGHTLAVATNPIFPRPAILHRLRWAGFDSLDGTFAIITDYESFHFSKPNPAFVAEVLARIGWPAQPAVMIGNSLADDLIPAARIGLPVFWVNPNKEPLPEGFHPSSASGTLAESKDWIAAIDKEGIRQDFSSPHAVLAVLKSTPAVIDSLAINLSERQWSERPEPEAWSLTEIFAHLRDVDREVNIPRLEKVMAENMPFLAGYNTDAWTEERSYRLEDGPTALRGFFDERMRLIEKLERLDLTDWERVARHAIFGPTSLREMVSFTATHDRNHVKQILQTAKTLKSETA
jgi:FMN phosphatase YigB (HAD superfamily)